MSKISRSGTFEILDTKINEIDLPKMPHRDLPSTDHPAEREWEMFREKEYRDDYIPLCAGERGSMDETSLAGPNMIHPGVMYDRNAHYTVERFDQLMDGGNTGYNAQAYYFSVEQLIRRPDNSEEWMQLHITTKMRRNQTYYGPVTISATGHSAFYDEFNALHGHERGAPLCAEAQEDVKSFMRDSLIATARKAGQPFMLSFEPPKGQDKTPQIPFGMRMMLTSGIPVLEFQQPEEYRELSIKKCVFYFFFAPEQEEAARKILDDPRMQKEISAARQAYDETVSYWRNIRHLYLEPDREDVDIRMELYLGKFWGDCRPGGSVPEKIDPAKGKVRRIHAGTEQEKGAAVQAILP